MSRTPGPWIVEKKRGEGFAVVSAVMSEPVLYKTGKKVGQIRVPASHLIVADSILLPAIWNEADAALIAAAPELLEAAKQFVAAWGRDMNDEDPEPLRAAIAKAEQTT